MKLQQIIDKVFKWKDLVIITYVNHTYAYSIFNIPEAFDDSGFPIFTSCKKKNTKVKVRQSLCCITTYLEKQVHVWKLKYRYDTS